MKTIVLGLVLCLLAPMLVMAMGDTLVIHHDKDRNSYINFSELDPVRQQTTADFLKKLDAIQLQLGNYRVNQQNLEMLCQQATQLLRSLAHWESTMEVVISTPLSAQDPCGPLIELVYINKYGGKVLPESRDYARYPEGRARWFLERHGSGSNVEWQLHETYYNWGERYRNIGNYEVVITGKFMCAHFSDNIEVLFGDGGQAPIEFRFNK
jgi:hypothetical protein